jgi:hypothetical protein
MRMGTRCMGLGEDKFTNTAGNVTNIHPAQRDSLHPPFFREWPATSSFIGWLKTRGLHDTCPVMLAIT